MFAPPQTIMEEDILKNLQPQSDVRAQQHSLAFIEQVKTSTDGWKSCIATLTDSAEHSEQVRFFCLQVIAHFALTQYHRSSNDERRKMKDFLSFWIHLQCDTRNAPQPSYFGNKAAQIFTAVFVQDYPTNWPNFFTDIAKTLSLGPGAVDCYLRVLMAIGEEITLQEIPRGLKEIERNNAIKTAMRESDILLLVESWFQILKLYQSTDNQLAKKCLEVIASYVSWINIDLIANDRFVEVLLAAMHSVEVREPAVDCLLEIVKKGMDPMAKIQLIETLLSTMVAAGVFEVIEEDDDTEFTSKLSSLVNGMGLALLECHKLLLKGGTPAQVDAVQEAIQTKIPLVLMYLGNDYDDVSSACLPFTREYIQMLKLKPLLNVKQQENIQSILAMIILKMKYDESYNFNHEGEDEADFDAYRKMLKVIFENLAGLNRDLILEYVTKYVLGTLPVWQSSSFQQVEVALTLMYYVGEAIPATVQSQYFYTDPGAPAPHMLRMMRALVTSGVNEHPHPHVTMQYFETAVRFEKYYQSEPDDLPLLLESFFDHRGLRHVNLKVRSRCAFLFLKLIKGLRTFVQPYTVDILRPLQDVLVLCLPDNGIGANAEDTSWVSLDDQLYLYEAAAIIIISSSCPSGRKAEAFRELLTPAFTKFSNLLAQINLETDPKRYENETLYLAHLMAVTSRTSKAFTNYQQLKSSACVNIFTDSLQVFLPSLQIPRSSDVVKSAMRQFLHRMVVCLEEHLLPYFVQASEGLLKDSDVTSIQEYLPLLVQIITKFKKEVLPFLTRAFIPITRAIYSAFALPMDENDEEMRREKLQLHRNYFGLICAISYHDLIEPLKAQDGPFMDEVKLTVVRATVEFQDILIQKCCFSILRQFVVMWINDPLFTDFMYKNIVPACFLAPMQPSFDLNDAQSNVVLNEIAMCMRKIYEKRGDELVNFLKIEYRPITCFQPADMERYCAALTGDPKLFKNFVKHFFKDIRK